MFLAHTTSLKENSYQVLDQYDKKKVLVNSSGYKLVSNVCPHQLSLISTTNGHGNRVCPYHNWSFTIDGLPYTSGRTEYYCKNLKPLSVDQTYTWNSLLFDCPVTFNVQENFDNMVLMESRIDTVNSDFRNIMDIFLDVDHIQSIHAGVYDQIGITDTTVNWTYTKNGSLQEVSQGALWLAVYPYTMIEWQKGSLFITVAMPKDNNNSKVHVFKYMDKHYKDTWELNEKVWETAWTQDKAQAEIITKFPHRNLEPQKQHYREFLRLHGTY